MTPDIQMAIAHGLHLLPVQARGKIPLISDWPNKASSDASIVQGWSEQYPGCNWGIACGLTSGIVVIDIDSRHGGDDALVDLQQQHGQLPPTWQVMTPGGGQHDYFRHPGVGPVNNSAGVIGPGIDARGDGGFVVCPPSIGANGRGYHWSVDDNPDDGALCDLPDWLLAKIDRPHVAPGSTPSAAPPEEWRGRVGSEVPEGQRNQRLAQLAGHLLRRQVDPYVALGLLQGWNLVKCRPPLDDTELQTTVANIAKRELARRQGGDHAA
jgi:Bifunctional DNA primase/polymerase, N-terminal/Primase C terminal 1 (PriCT-1)